MGLRYISADQIFTGEEWLQSQVIGVENGHIVSVTPTDKISSAAEEHYEVLVPAFIDIQLYGAQGKLLAVFPDADTLQKTYEYCIAGGAVLFLPTVATNTMEVFRKCIDAVRDYWQQGGRGVYGLHLEGPWLNAEKRGAHVESLIHAPTIEEVREILNYGKGVIKMITVAPEVCSAEVIRLMIDHDIIISAGHSNASFEEAAKGFSQGITAVTHLYNAMSPLHHRTPGLTGAAMADKKVMASVIPDGHHVDYNAIRIAKAAMGDRLYAITDAVTETSDGFYQHKLAGDKYECNNVLSGSALTMNGCFQNLMHHTGIESGEALRMCSLYPAKVLKQDHLYGKIASGYAAQFVVLTKQLEMSKAITL